MEINSNCLICKGGNSTLDGVKVQRCLTVQYASLEFRKVLKENGFIQSMSRKGNCWDNAVAESFFHTLKTQLIYHIRFSDFEETERILFKYIEVYYNNQRRKHSTNGWKSPARYEQEWYNLENVLRTAPQIFMFS